MNSAAIDPIGPSLIVRLVVSPLSKLLNPAVAKLAGRRFFAMVAAIHHVGRRSGKSYVTPVNARVNKDIALVPLTFGNQSDWVRNVRAARHCWIRVNGKYHHGMRPQFVNWADAKPLVRTTFSPLQRMALRSLGIKQFMRIDITSSADQSPSATAGLTRSHVTTPGTHFDKAVSATGSHASVSGPGQHASG
ncbi:MAG: nitroreductase family deazaflavin-dependent oxidoreductase [Mycobacterium sp.]|nr:nitroreductase family deazaflavin-dependent oxidoreductase [Mycobacterium sp.]